MKLNIQKIAYRAIPVLAALVVVVSCVAVPTRAATSAVNGYTIIDYNDYVSNLKVDGDNDIVSVSLPAYMYGWTKEDSTGYSKTEGVPLGKLDCKLNDDILDNAGVFFPAGFINRTFMDLSNIPDGSVFKTTNKIWIEPESLDPNGIFDVRYRSRIAYYDSNFQLIKNDTSPIEEVLYVPHAYVYDLEYEVAISKPDNAKYCTTYFFFEVLSVPYMGGAVAPVWFDFDIPKLQMSISSLYRLQEQTGKTNELLGDLINGTPGQNEAINGAVGGMQNAAGELEDIGDQLAGVDKPDADSIDVSLNSLVPYNAMLAYVAPIKALWENSTLLGMLSIVVVLAIVSWVFYGKKV